MSHPFVGAYLERTSRILAGFIYSGLQNVRLACANSGNQRRYRFARRADGSGQQVVCRLLSIEVKVRGVGVAGCYRSGCGITAAIERDRGEEECV